MLTQQAPQLELAMLERLAAGAYAQMDAAVRASAVRGGGYRPVSPVPRDISEASTVASATEEVRRAP
ncbi:hypothetical protein [Nocardia sp. NPDC050412]|uniref:hypothetical protein n=1 Tax=Nocardia sp. NPDC050412 TaxID=3364320 RepID=UPI0037B5DC15